MTPNNTTTSTAEYANASMDVMGSFGNSSSLFGVVVGILWLVTLFTAVLYATQNLHHFPRLEILVTAVFESFEYALWGVAGVAALVIVGAPFYMATRVDPGTQQAIVKTATVALGGYAALAAFGWFVKRLFKRAAPYLPEATTDADEPDVTPVKE